MDPSLSASDDRPLRYEWVYLPLHKVADTCLLFDNRRVNIILRRFLHVVAILRRT